MSRIDRKNWTEDQIQYKERGGLFDLFDNAFKSVFRVTDSEMDLLCEKMDDEEMGIMVDEKDKSFSHGRRIIQILNKYINYE